MSEANLRAALEEISKTCPHKCCAAAANAALAAPTGEVLPQLTTERPDTIGVGYLKLRKHDGVHRTDAGVDANLDFDEEGNLLGVEFMAWPEWAKQHPRTSQKSQVGNTDE